MCISYLINQKYYAEVLCENKPEEEEEDSCCHGKCAMEKELVKLDEKEEDQSAKTPNSTFKITKSEEAVVKNLVFSSFQNCISLINIPFMAKLKKGVVTVLMKPPTTI